MAHSTKQIAALLQGLDLGASVAEQDDVLQTARVETSVFSDLLEDRVDLIPGTKGSGKSALYRIFVDFLPELLLRRRRIVVAHGVHAHGDNVFNAYRTEFARLTEDDFVRFWCIYFTSLAHQHFIKAPTYAGLLKEARKEIGTFGEACAKARIPDIKAPKTLYDVLGNILRHLRPRVVVDQQSGELSLDLFGSPVQATSTASSADSIPRYVHQVQEALDAILVKADLSLWLMVDRLDEIFLRRSVVETTALRGLLRTIQPFQTKRIRVKVFLRDDILYQLTSGGRGFVALTHVTARQSDKLRWSEDQILTLVVKRLFTHAKLCTYLNVDRERLNASQEYQREAFYKVFPERVHASKNQSPTLRWIYTHTMDGKLVVTPRDVIDLLTRAKEKQQDICNSDPTGSADCIIGSTAIQYGLKELSNKKRDTYLNAEFPHFWSAIKRLIRGKTEYSEQAILTLLGDGQDNREALENLVGIGLLEVKRREGKSTYIVPFVYRGGLDLTQGHVE